MRVARILACAAALGITTALTVTLPAVASGSTAYVALGDSYSSGVGTGDYDSSSGSCYRSPESYPSLWVAAHSVSSFSFTACSGAKTGDVLNNQLGPLSPSTTLVSMTIGGNDAGFSSVMTTCITSSDSGCRAAVTNAEHYAQNTLPGLLDNLYNAIRSRAPYANVDILGYPDFYQVPGYCWVGIDDNKRSYIDEGANVLDGVIRDAAGRHAFSWIDVRSIFSAHEICSSGTAWIHSVDWGDMKQSYHPTTSGYEYGYLPALDSATS